MIEIHFNVLERADAKSFFIYNEGATVASTITLTVADDNDWEGTPLTISGDSLAAFNSSQGLEVEPSDVDYPHSSFLDGVYTFLLTAAGYDDSTHVEGFSAIITLKVIKDSLQYRMYQSKAVKDYILNKTMRLNNLAYAAATGNVDAFQENLQILQRLK